MSTSLELAAEADRLVGVAPRRALTVAGEALQLARRDRDTRGQAAAYRVQSQAHLTLGNAGESLRDARLAVSMARRTGDAGTQTEAHIALAVALWRRGSLSAALRQLETAAPHAPTELTGRLLAQRGTILSEVGRPEEAMEAYRQALPLLRRAGEELREARTHNNLGVLYALNGNLTAAERSLTTARTMQTELGQDSMAADSCWNLGFVAARRGDVPQALALYDEAEATYVRCDVPNDELLLDRCELLLSVGLTSEARSVAARAVEQLDATGQSAFLAEGLLMLAQAALADGDSPAARQAADRAARLFTRQQRDRWALLARYVGVRADEHAGVESATVRRRARRLIPALAHARLREQELDTRIISARSALRAGSTSAARRDLAATAVAARRGSVDLKSRAWHATALLRAAEGNRKGAQAAVRAGLAAVDRQRALLGATELRVHAALHGAELAMLGVRLAHETGSAEAVLIATERWRAGALRLPPARPPDDTRLAAELAALRSTTAALERAQLGSDGGSDNSVNALRRQRGGLEQRILRLTRQAAGTAQTTSSVPSMAALKAALQGRQLVEIVRLDDELLAIVVGAGRPVLQPLGALEPAMQAAESIRFAVRRLAVGQGSAAAAEQALASASARLDQLLFGPIRAELGTGPLVVVPPGPLQALPWSLLPTCADRPVVVAPSAASWLAAVQGRPRGRGVAVVAGPELAGAEREVGRVAELYGRARRFAGVDATVEAVLAGMDGASVAHLAAHGRLRHDNPLFSSIQLADGPLTVYDLERLRQAPDLVVLPACQSGVTAALAGDELLGLTSALFGLGTRSIIAAVVPVDDRATEQLMIRLHHELRAGRTPSAALAATIPTQAALTERVTHGAFVCFGAG